MKLAKIVPALFLGMLLLAAAGSQPGVAAMSRDAGPGLLRAAVKLMTPFEFSKDAGSLCSAAILNQEGYILTSFRCVGYGGGAERDRELERAGFRPGDYFNRQGVSIVAVTSDLRYLPAPTYVARVLVADPELDLAVLKISGYLNSKQPLPKTLPIVALPLGDSTRLAAADEVRVIGFGSDIVSAAPGKVTRLADAAGDDGPDWLQIDVPFRPGNGGAPVVNAQGELIGVATERWQDANGEARYLVRPAQRAIALIQRALRAGESVAGVGDVGPGPEQKSAPGQTIGALTFGAGFRNGDLTDPAFGFVDGTTAVHAAVSFQGLRDGLRWGYAWRLDGQSLASKNGLKWIYGATGVLDLYLASERGLADGVYTLQIFVEDVLAQEGRFTVTAPDRTRAPQKPSDVERDAGVTVIGVVTDHSTRKPIQGAAVAFLRPGKTIRDYDADASKDKSDTVQALGVTSANGVFISDALLARGQAYGMVVAAQGYRRIAGDAALSLVADEPPIVQLESIKLDRQ